MKLLFDQNLSHELVSALNDLFPESSHVRNVRINRSADDVVWNFAKDGGYTIVSKDEDFHQRSFLYGAPPKVIWIRLGNCSTSRVVECLRRNIHKVRAFDADKDAAFLILS